MLPVSGRELWEKLSVKRTLVLNAGYEPLQLISWQRAITLLFSAKAEIVAEHREVIRTVSREYSLPSVIRLTRYVRVIKRMGIATCTRKNVLLRDHYECQYCGVQCRPATVTIDHIIPRSKGGSSSWNNLVAACPTCNRRKGNKLLAEAGMSLRKAPRTPAWRELMQDSKFELQEEWLLYLDYAS